MTCDTDMLMEPFRRSSGDTATAGADAARTCAADATAAVPVD